MKRGRQLKFKQLTVIIIAWTMMGFIISVYDNFVLHTSFSVGPAKDYSFFVSIATNMGAGLVGALLGGSLLVFM